MIDFTAELKDLDGKPIPDTIARQGNGNLPNTPALTLGRAAAHALCTPQPNEKAQPSGDEKYRRAKLAYEIRDSANAELPAEDIALIKTMMGQLYAPVVIFAAWPLLDPPAAKKAASKAA